MIATWVLNAVFALVMAAPSPERRLPVFVYHLPALIGCLTIFAVWAGTTPQNNRDDWSPEAERVVRSTVEGDRLELHNLRDFRYASPDSYEARWAETTFDLRELATVDLFVSEISLGGIVGHVMFSFGFTDGRHLVASAEIRRQQGESYGPTRGCFRNYELIYVLGTETDLIDLRLNHRGNPLRLYPIETTAVGRRALLLEILERANALAEEPEFYHTLVNNCTTNLVQHVDALVGDPFITGWRRTLPESAAKRAFLAGYLKSEATDWEAARAEALLPPLPQGDLSAEAWSRALRRSR